MPYQTFSEDAPGNNSISTGFINLVPNNPVHSGSHSSNYPSYYDQFVTKTNSNNNGVVNITDERRDAATEVFQTAGTYTGYMFLHHRPLLNSSIGITNGGIATGATDYNNGIVYFTTLPTGSFNVSYLAVPDAYWGDHINAIQNAIMNLQRTVGAGSNSGEGFKNATVLLQDYPAGLQAILPNATHIEGLDRSLAIKSIASTANTITLGNGGDTVVIDARNFLVKNTDVSYSLSGRIGEDTNDKIYIPGLVAILATSGHIGTGHGSGAVFTVGNPFASTSSGIAAAVSGYSIPSTGSPPIARFFGDIQVIGNIYLTGAVVAVPTTTGGTVTLLGNTVLIGQDLYVTGNTTLGNSTSKTTTINGPAIMGRYIHVKALNGDISRIDGPIDVRNPGNSNNNIGGSYSDSVVPRGSNHFPDLPFHIGGDLRNVGPYSDFTLNKVTTFDGLDPSYIAKLLRYRALDRHDYKHNVVNRGSYVGITGSVTSVSAPGTSVWFDSGLSFSTGLLPYVTGFGFPLSGYYSEGNKPSRWFHIGGNYYHGKFLNEQRTINSGEFSGVYNFGDANEWSVLWTQNDTNGFVNPGAWKYGAQVPLTSITFQYATGSPYLATGNATVEVSRAFNTAIQVGDTYEIYHPKYSRPNALVTTADSSVVRVNASPIKPIVANINGITKLMTTNCDLTIPSDYTGNSFVYVELDTPEIAKQQNTPGSVLETEATVSLSTTYAESDSKILLGEIYSIDPGVGAVSTRTYAYNTEYDSLWFRMQNTGNLGQFNSSGQFSWWTNNAVGTYISTSGVLTNTGKIENGSPYFLSPEDPYDVLVSTGGSYKVRIYHNAGSIKRLKNTDLKVLVAPNLGNDYPSHFTGISFREGPDYAYIQELETYKGNHINNSGYPCYDVVHVDRNYSDLVFYNLAEVPGAIIGARTSTGSRNYALTGSYGETGNYGTATTPADRTRAYWWARVIVN